MKRSFSHSYLKNLPSQLTISLILVLLLYSLFSSALYAQSACEEALLLATEEYEQGYFDRATFRLQTCLDSEAFNNEQQKEAYLLLGKIYYANLQIEDAKESVRKLLSENPAYKLNPDEHKPGFIDLYKEVKSEIIDTKQPITNRSGFWLNIGGGLAEGRIRCDCPLVFEDTEVWKEGGPGGSFTLAIGTTLNPKLQLGAELSQWERNADLNSGQSSATIVMLSVLAKYYPYASSNFFLKGGIGVGSSELERDFVRVFSNSIKLDAGGLGMQFGLGFDIPLGRQQNIALTPFVNVSVLLVEEDTERADFLRDRQVSFIEFSGPKNNPTFFQLGLAFSIL